MSWKDRIPSCFGSKDRIFAGHHSDCKSASQLLAQANEENIGWKEYTQTIREWLESQGCGQEHIQEQMKRVKNLKYYLNYD